jgi:hypothetical protein
MSFLVLSNDLKDAIATRLTTSDMANLSRTCKGLHECVASVMYRSLGLTWIRNVQYPESHICDLSPPKIGSFLETVL